MNNVWDLAGMSMSQYRILPWPEKRKLLIRHRGIYILDSCFNCGKSYRLMQHEEKMRAMPKELRHHKFGELLWAYRQHIAETQGG